MNKSSLSSQTDQDSSAGTLMSRFKKTLKKLHKRYIRWRYPHRGVTLRNELLYVMVKLKLAPLWLDMKNGMKIGIGFDTPRILFKRWK